MRNRAWWIAWACGPLCLIAISGYAADHAVIQPGYAPGVDAKRDERGIWMEMEEAEAQLARSPLLLEGTSSLTRYTRETACRVAGAYCDDIRVYVIRNSAFNASMTPNGVMLVHTGLLARVASTDQLAAVLGHELAHYTQTHSIIRFRAAKSRMTVGAVVSLGLGASGVDSGGLPELIAMSSVMSFTRDQESEADTLGVKFMADSGFDPAAAAGIWRMLEEEEASATVKSPRPAIFLSSHPAPESRARVLTELASGLNAEREPNEQRMLRRDPLIAVLEEHYDLLMDEQIKQRDAGRVFLLLARHQEMGINPSRIAFYMGEAWRMEEGPEAMAKAIEQYRIAAEADGENYRAFRELGYLLYKQGEEADARRCFKRYLELVPDAPDREMIGFYMEGQW